MKKLLIAILILSFNLTVLAAELPDAPYKLYDDFSTLDMMATAINISLSPGNEGELANDPDHACRIGGGRAEVTYEVDEINEFELDFCLYKTTRPSGSIRIYYSNDGVLWRYAPAEFISMGTDASGNWSWLKARNKKALGSAAYLRIELTDMPTFWAQQLGSLTIR